MRRLLLLFAFCVPTSLHAQDYPHLILKNDTVRMTVMTPDAKKGFYRGTRFDWAGVIGPVEVHGKKVFLPWKDKHNPENNDDITGPCDEFGMHSPLRYNEAKPGQRFLKIGVGDLIKAKDEEYAFWKKYEIAEAGTWKTVGTADGVVFEQDFSSQTGYAYRYSKRITLKTNGFRIDYSLKNTGQKGFETDVYNHNFFNVEGASTGVGFKVTYGFVPKPKESKERFNELVAVNDKTLSLTGPLDKGSIYTLLEGYDQSPCRFGITGGGLSMKVKGDQPVSKMALWGVKTTLCPEPFIAISLPRDETKTWQWDYEFQVGH